MDIFNKLNEERNARIEQYMIDHNLISDGDYMFAMIEVDMNSERTTNWKMLEMIGIDPAVADLDTIIQGLSKWGINFVNYSPSIAFLDYIKATLLLEDVPLIPPNPSSTEIIDFSGTLYEG